MDREFWKRNDHTKEKELTEICEQINEGKLHLTCKQIAERLGTTTTALKTKKSDLGLITDPRILHSPKKTETNEKENIEMPGLNETEQKVILYLKKRARSVGDISRELDKSKESIIKILDVLREKHYDIKFDKEAHMAILERFPQEIKETLELEPLYRNHWKLGIIGDTHIGCLPPQAKIWTSAGEKRICHIKTGDLVLTHKNHYKKVLNVSRRKMGNNEKIIQLIFRWSGNSNRLTLTGNHPILINRQGKEQWLSADKIAIGDFVLSISKKCAYCKIRIPYWRKTCNSHDPYTKSRAKYHKKRFVQNYRRKGNQHYHKDILPEAEKLKKEGWRVIPIGKVLPDIIGLKNGKITAFEIESGYRTSYCAEYKYSFPEIRNLYDDVKWIFKKKRKKEHNWNYIYTKPNQHKFIGIEVVGIRQCIGNEESRLLSRNISIGIRTKENYTKGVYHGYVYNLEVEEDGTYIANRCVVHNSIAQQTTLLNTCYKIGEEEGIDTMFHAGDMLDGNELFRGHDQELWLHSADDQEDWVINNWPYTKKFKTYLVGGTHDMIFKKRIGHNALRAICSRREDIVYRGEVSAEFIYHNKNIKVCLMHPSGGLSYAVSYSPQKIVENVVSAVMAKIRATNDSSLIPHIFIFGHFHRTMWMPYMGTQIFLSPCLQGQTPYLAQKGWSPVVGMLLVQVDFDDSGNITSIKHDFRDFSHLVKDHDY